MSSSSFGYVVQLNIYIVIVGVFLLMGNVTLSHMSGSMSLLTISQTVLDIKTLSLPFIVTLGACLSLLLGVLTDAVRPFLKKFASLLPEKENMFKKLSPQAKQYIAEHGLYDLTDFDSIVQTSNKRSLAQFNHQLVYLAKRMAEYHRVGSLLLQADRETDLYTLLSVGAIGLSLQSLMLTISVFLSSLHAPPMGEWFLLSTTFIFGALSLLFSSRAKISMLHGFFHANNVLNDLPYLDKTLPPRSIN